jgi:hypothetical protein
VDKVEGEGDGGAIDAATRLAGVGGTKMGARARRGD